MNTHRILVLFLVASLAVGQNSVPSGKADLQQTTLLTDALNKKIELLSTRVMRLEKEVEDAQSTLKFLSPQILSILPSKQAVFDPSVLNKYSRLDLDNGFVLVSLHSAAPYLDGIQTTLEIGNPLYVTYSGFKISTTWGKRYDYSKGTLDGYSAWRKSLHSKEESFTDSLLPGSWTQVQLLLPDTKTSDFGYLEITIATDTVSLRR